MSEAARVPGIGWYIVAGALALAGVLAAAGLVAWLIANWEEGVQFVAPGRQVLELRAGKHVVWNDHVTVFQGRSFQSSKNLPDGVQVTVTRSDGGDVPLRSASGATYKGLSTERVAVMQFDTAAPGRYEIAVRGDFPARVFSVGPDHVSAVLWTAFGAIGALFLGMGAGIGVAAWAFLRREQAREDAPRAAAPAVAGDARDTTLRQLTMAVYVLQLASILVGITLVAGAIINYLKRGEVKGTWLESHFRWQIRTFWWSLLWFGVGLALLIFIVGFFILGALAIWLLYRAIKGWLELEERRPMYA